MPNLVQEYLQNGGTVEELATKYSIKANRHSKYPNLVLLKYNQIESPFAEPLVQHCRGLILDENDGWRVVSWPFNKFFNHGEGHAAPIDWDTAKVFEKLDGSLMTLYWYDGKWHVASSGTADAGGEVNGLNITFKDLFWKVWNESGYLEPWEDSMDYNFMFEMCTPYNRVVVPHKENSLHLIGVRNRVTGEEKPVEAFAHKGWKIVRSFPLNSLDGILDSLKVIDGVKQEGYVVVDKAFNRQKIKSPQYVAIHHLKDGFSIRRILEIIRSGEKSEFLTYFPEWTGLFEEIRKKFEDFVAKLEAVYEANKHIEIQKDFALAVKDYPCSGALFALRGGKTPSIRHFLADMNIRSLMDYLKVKDIQLVEN